MVLCCDEGLVCHHIQHWLVLASGEPQIFIKYRFCLIMMLTQDVTTPQRCLIPQIYIFMRSLKKHGLFILIMFSYLRAHLLPIGSLYDLAPAARAVIWFPMQIPNTGWGRSLSSTFIGTKHIQILSTIMLIMI